VDARVEGLVLALDVLDDRAGDEIDSELARERPCPADRVAVERLRTRLKLLARTEDAPLLGQYDELRAARSRVADEPVGSREIAVKVVGRVKLDSSSTQWQDLLLID
jgi:hypothetical protein